MGERRVPGRVAVWIAATVLGVALASGPAASEPARVTFLVTAPATTPEGATLFVSGSLAELGNWNGAGVTLQHRGPRSFAASVVLPSGAEFEYKLTRGSWDTVEKGPGGEEIDNRRAVARDGDSLRVTVAAWREGGDAKARPSTRTGDVRVHPAFASTFVKPRDVLVWLPPGYAADTTRRYPVLYFHDGNNMLDDSTSFVGEWRLDETAARVIAAGRVTPFIAVAVYNTNERMSEYTPVADARHGGGASGAYARFLVEELKPFIDRRYRTRPQPAFTGVAGSSLGGLVSLVIAIDHPDVFGLVGAVSPSAWWGGGWIARRAATAPRSLRVWMDIGTAEGSAAGAAGEVQGVEAVRSALVHAGLSPSDRPGPGRLHFEIVAGARHNEAAWAARLDRILEFMLPPGTDDAAR